MTLRYLLDSNILSDFVRNPRGRVGAHIERLGGQNICTSIFVAAELRYGVAKKGSERLRAAVEDVLSRMPILAFEQPADDLYGVLRAELERRGQPIGHFDYLIAAHALASDCVVVTDNEREFSRVPGLTVENWLR